MKTITYRRPERKKAPFCCALAVDRQIPVAGRAHEKGASCQRQCDPPLRRGRVCTIARTERKGQNEPMPKTMFYADFDGSITELLIVRENARFWITDGGQAYRKGTRIFDTLPEAEAWVAENVQP